MAEEMAGYNESGFLVMGSSRVRYIEELDGLGLGILDYVIIGSSPLAVRGWKNNRNIDICVKQHMWDKLRNLHYPGNKLMQFHIGRDPTLELDNVSINRTAHPFENIEGLIMRGEIIEGHNYISLPDLIACKSYTSSPQDVDDIGIIIRHCIDSELHNMLHYLP